MSTLIVDGYNVIHQWLSLQRRLRGYGLEEARRSLITIMGGYSAATGVQVTIVFDAHTRLKGSDDVTVIDGVSVRFGSSSASADHVIERLANEAARRGEGSDVRVATSDKLQRNLITAMGVATISASGLELEVQRAAEDVMRVRDRLSSGPQKRRLEDIVPEEVRRYLEELRRGRS